MNLNKVVIAVAGILILSGPAQSINGPSMGFIQRGFKSCTDNCKVDACKVQKNRKWCEDKCSHKINMQDVCKISNSNKYNLNNLNNPLSAKEQKLIGQYASPMAPADMPQALPQ